MQPTLGVVQAGCTILVHAGPLKPKLGDRERVLPARLGTASVPLSAHAYSVHPACADERATPQVVDTGRPSICLSPETFRDLAFLCLVRMQSRLRCGSPRVQCRRVLDSTRRRSTSPLFSLGHLTDLPLPRSYLEVELASLP